MKKIILLILISCLAKIGFAQTPVSPVQLTTNTPYLEPSTSLHWYYNGATYNWYKALGVKDSTYYITPWYASQHFAPVGSGVLSFNTRVGAVVPLVGDYSAFYPVLSGSYANPSWITSLAWSKITSTPTTLAGYGITDAYTKTASDARFAPIAINGTVTSITPGYGFTSSTPITSSGTLTIDSTKLLTVTRYKNNQDTLYNKNVQNLHVSGSNGHGGIFIPYNSNDDTGGNTMPTPSSGVVLYSRGNNYFGWKGTNGFSVSFLSQFIGGNIAYSLPATNGATLATINGGQNFTSAFFTTAPTANNMTVRYQDTTLYAMSSGYATPQRYGADGTGVTDATTAIRTTLSANQNVKLYGTYLVSDSLVLRSNQTIYSDNATINFTGSAKSLFVMLGLVNTHLVGNLTINGLGNSAGTQVAIHLSGGNSNEISGVTFRTMQGWGILINNYNSTNFTRGNTTLIHDCFFVDNYIGFETAPRSPDGVEYYTLANSTFRSNTFPILTYAGNQKFIGLNVIDNTNGIYVDGSGANAAHDTWTACNISHNTNYNAYLTGITLGESFVNCNMYGTVTNGITVVNSVGVSFAGGSIDGILDVDATSLVTLTGVKQASAFTIPTNSARVTQTGNFTLTGPVNETNKLQIGSVVGNAGTMLFNNTPTTGYINIYDVSNTSGHLKSALEGSVAGTVATGTTAYGGVIGTVSNTKFNLMANNNVMMSFDPSGTLNTGGGVVFGQNAVIQSASVTVGKNLAAFEPGFSSESVLTRTSNTSGGLRDFIAAGSLGAGFAANITNNDAGLQGFSATQSIAAGATGTVTAAAMYRGTFTNNSAMNIGTLWGLKFVTPTNSGGGTITNYNPIATGGTPTGATNITHLLIGATAQAAGTWAIYNSSSYNSFSGTGNFQVGSATATAGAPKLDVTGSIGSTALAVNSPVFSNANSVLTTTVPAGYFTFRGAGQTTLVSGTKAISVTGVTTSSQAFVNVVSQGGTVSTTFEYAVVCTSGTITITALTNGNVTNTLDTSVLNYYVIN